MDKQLQRRRWFILVRSYARMVDAIEAGCDPSDADLGLMLAAIADAAVARDSAAANAASSAGLSLLGLVAEKTEEQAELRGRLLVLAEIAGMVALITEPVGA